jgi:hypothetical protein
MACLRRWAEALELRIGRGFYSGFGCVASMFPGYCAIFRVLWSILCNRFLGILLPFPHSNLNGCEVDGFPGSSLRLHFLGPSERYNIGQGCDVEPCHGNLS